MKFKLVALLKDFVLFSRLPLLLAFLYRPLKFLVNTIGISKWIKKYHSGFSFNDFYRGARKYSDREKLYQHVIDTKRLAEEQIHYLEFGVCGGISFRWWLEHNTHPASRFFGFDTFEGLPENWFLLRKGDLNAEEPELKDSRGQFIKGLFQHTFWNFLQTNYTLPEAGATLRKVIHMDADLFSSTLFVLTSIAPYLNKGDIIFFDEFNVPNHEYAAWEDFVSSYYVDFEVLGAVNNYFQVAVQYNGMGIFRK
ncbi:MAG TPA: class I SAM-dependent methyltransferase [Edaphocola sp.]|nr:class I SAM-dependent methyltransferase [Edaphocola sp.]